MSSLPGKIILLATLTCLQQDNMYDDYQSVHAYLKVLRVWIEIKKGVVRVTISVFIDAHGSSDSYINDFFSRN